MWLRKFFNMNRIIFLLLTVFIFGCSNLDEEVILPVSSEPQAQDTSTNEPSSVSIVAPPSQQTENVEILWQVEENPPEGFILKYGESPELLSAEVRILTSEIEKITDPKFGSVYRFVIKGIQPESKLFVSVASFTGTKESGFSTPTQVPLN